MRERLDIPRFFDRAMSRFRLASLPFLFLSCALTQVRGSEPAPRPKIRTVTAFVRIGGEYHQQIDEAVVMLHKAKATFETQGYEVQTIRITTQPFPQYVRNRTQSEALELLEDLDRLAKKNGFLLNIGAVSPIDGSEQYLELLRQALSKTRANASLVVAGDDGVHWGAVRAAAQVIKYVENHSPNGVNNFDFAAVAMVPPNNPFFPASNHDGPGRQFAIGWEAGAMVQDAFHRAHGNIPLARELLSQALGQQAVTVERIAKDIEKDLGWKYVGLDPTPAPNMDSSIGAAIETLIGARVGAPGTLSAAAVITEAERSISVERTGFSGLMLPILEDPVLAERWSEGALGVDSLLAYSAVCGTGLDTVPLPGDVSQEELERMIGDMASLAFKWHKPLTARLIPAPGKKAGDRTDFDFGVAKFPSATLRPVR